MSRAGNGDPRPFGESKQYSEKLSSDLVVIINKVVGEVIPVRVVRLKGKAKDYRVATK
jgi:hypothetical protein